MDTELLKYAVNAFGYGQDIFEVSDHPFQYYPKDYFIKLRKILSKLGLETLDFTKKPELINVEFFYAMEDALKEIDSEHQITPEFFEKVVEMGFIKDLPDVN